MNISVFYCCCLMSSSYVRYITCILKGRYNASSWYHQGLSKRGRQRQHQEAIIIFIRNPRIFLNISFLCLHCMFNLFSLKFRWLQRLFLNETMDVSSWNVGHVLKTAWKWSSWSLIWEQDAHIKCHRFISDIHVRFLSIVIYLIVLPALPSSFSAVLL